MTTQRDALEYHDGPHALRPTHRFTVTLDAEGHPHIGWCGLDGVFCRSFDGAQWTVRQLAEHPVGRLALAHDGTRLHALFDRGGNRGFYGMEGENAELVLVSSAAGEEPVERVVATKVLSFAAGGLAWDLAARPDRIALIWRSHLGNMVAPRERRIVVGVVGADGQLQTRVLVEEVDFLGEVAIDQSPDGRLHVLYAAEQRAHHAAGEGLQDLDPTPVTSEGEDDELGLVAADDAVHIVYQGTVGKKNRGFLRTCRQGAWEEPVPFPVKGHSGFGASVALDTSGEPVVCFRVQSKHRNQNQSKAEATLHRAAGPRLETIDDLGEIGASSAFAQRGDHAWIVASANHRGGMAVFHAGPPSLDHEPTCPDLRYPAEIYVDALAARLEADPAVEMWTPDRKKYARLKIDGTEVVLERGKAGKDPKVKTYSEKTEAKAMKRAVDLAAHTLDDYRIDGLSAPWD